MPRSLLAMTRLVSLYAACAPTAGAFAANLDRAGGNNPPKWRNHEDPALSHADFQWPARSLGNTLTAYWNSRATAACREEAFAARATEHPLLQKLRSHVPRQTLTPGMRRKCDLLARVSREEPGAVCWGCIWPHDSEYAPWRLFTDVIFEETRALVRQFDVHPLARDPYTVTIHIRCDVGILKKNHNYGLLRHLFYNSFIRDDITRVVLVSMPETLGLGANASQRADPSKCTLAALDLKAFLEGAHPSITVQMGGVSGDDVGDWLFLASARTVVLSPSTFSFTATLGNPNTVVFPLTEPQRVVAQNGRRISAWPTFAGFSMKSAEFLGGTDIGGMDGDDVIEWLHG